MDAMASLANAAVRAIFVVEGRIDDTASARVGDDGNIRATRAFRTQLRKELEIADAPLTTRERAMVKAIRELLGEVGSELYHAGADEVRTNPILRSKQRVVDRIRRQVDRWSRLA